MDAPAAADRDARRRRAAHAVALAFLAALAAAPFVACALRGEIPFFQDIEDHWYPLRLNAWRAREAGGWAHWFPHAFAGVPFLGQLESATYYPPNLAFDWIHPAYRLVPLLVLHRALPGLLTYAVALRRGCRPLAAACGGAAATLCGEINLAASNPPVLAAVAWLPALVLGLDLVAERRRALGAAVLALGASMSALAGYPAYLQRMGPLLAILLVLHPAAPRTAADWRERGVRAVWLAAGVALGGALAAAQVLPSLHLTAVSQRALGLDPALLDLLRAAPSDLLLLVAPATDSAGGVARHGFVYVGVATWVLAALAVIRGVPGARALAVGVAFAAVAALGSATPLDGLLRLTPMASSFRNPTQYLIAAYVALPVLGALGLETWLRAPPSPRAIAAAAAPVAAAICGAALVHDGAWASGTLLRISVSAAAVLGTVAAALALRTRAVAAAACVAALVVLDAQSLGFAYPTRRGRARPIADVMAAEPTLARIADHARAHGGQPPRVFTSNARFNWDNRVAAAGIDNARGLMSLSVLRSLDVTRIVDEGAPFDRGASPQLLYDYGPVSVLASPRLDLLAVRYAVGFPGEPPGTWTRIGPEEWVRDAPDPARLVRAVVRVPAGGDAARALLAPDFDARGACVVESDAALDLGTMPAGEPPAVRVERPDPDTAEMQVDAPVRSVLLWTETHDEGWTADVDGAPVAVLRANHGFMAVVVPPGAHRVTWRYEAPRWRLGVAVSIAALALWWALVAAGLPVGRTRESATRSTIR